MTRAVRIQLALTVAAVLGVFYTRLKQFPGGSPFELFLLLNILLAVVFRPPAALASVLLGCLGAHAVMMVEARVPTRYATMMGVYLTLSGILVFLNHRWHRAKDRSEAQRVAHEEQRERLLAEAQEANRAKDRLLANVSHELRTPLNAIAGWAHMMGHRNASPEEVRRAAQVIKRNAEALGGLVDELLDVSLAVAGRVRLQSTPVELGKTVKAAVESILPEAAAQGITVECAVPRDVGTIPGDPQRLHQVLLTVLSNAIKFTDSGGRIDIEAKSADDCITIEITDSGIGIEPEFLPFVFERFSQADGSTTRPYRGMGLGLAIAKDFVELMGGRITVASQGKSRGTTVSIQFPTPFDTAAATFARA